MGYLELDLLLHPQDIVAIGEPSFPRLVGV